MKDLNLDRIAIRKVGIEGWRPYLYEAAVGGVIVTGCMTTPKVRGPNKGEPKFLTGLDQKTVVVTKEDIEADDALMKRMDEGALCENVAAKRGKK